MPSLTLFPLPLFPLSSLSSAQELDALKEGEQIFKFLGKVLVRQDPLEAKTRVEGRLKMIETSM